MTANNMASMHGVLKAVIEKLLDCAPTAEQEWPELVQQARAALAEPPRNCDVGTVEEQRRRKHEYCKETQCSGCPANKGGTISTDRCDFTWAQMPFDSRGKCGDAQ